MACKRLLVFFVTFSTLVYGVCFSRWTSRTHTSAVRRKSMSPDGFNIRRLEGGGRGRFVAHYAARLGRAWRVHALDEEILRIAASQKEMLQSPTASGASGRATSVRTRRPPSLGGGGMDHRVCGSCDSVAPLRGGGEQAGCPGGEASALLAIGHGAAGALPCGRKTFMEGPRTAPRPMRAFSLARFARSCEGRGRRSESAPMLLGPFTSKS